MISEKRVGDEARGEQGRKAAGSRTPCSDRGYSATGRYFMVRLSKMHITGYILPLALIIMVLLGLLTACAGPQHTQNPAGTATQDPPMPQITEATHGIVDTTGTVPQSLIEQLRARSDDVQAHGFQIAVVFFNDLASDPHQFATDVFNKNGIGFKDTNNGVLFVLYLQKPGKDGHAPWLAYITGGGISGSLPDTLMDDYAQTTFVPARAQRHWQDGLLAFYDKVSAAERDPSIAQDWQTKHPKAPTGANPSGNPNSSPGNIVVIVIFVCIATVVWLMVSAIVASRRRENFFYTAFRLLGRLLILLVVISRSTRGGSYPGRGGSSSGGGGFGSWGGGGSSPSSGGDV